MSVSYTHLDVYKRQSKECLGLSPIVWYTSFHSQLSFYLTFTVHLRHYISKCPSNFSSSTPSLHISKPCNFWLFPEILILYEHNTTFAYQNSVFIFSYWTETDTDNHHTRNVRGKLLHFNFLLSYRTSQKEGKRTTKKVINSFPHNPFKNFLSYNTWL